jgi:hypothetical protein
LKIYGCVSSHYLAIQHRKFDDFVSRPLEYLATSNL